MVNLQPLGEGAHAVAWTPNQRPIPPDGFWPIDDWFAALAAGGTWSMRSHRAGLMQMVQNLPHECAAVVCAQWAATNGVPIPLFRATWPGIEMRFFPHQPRAQDWHFAGGVKSRCNLAEAGVLLESLFDTRQAPFTEHQPSNTEDWGRWSFAHNPCDFGLLVRPSLLSDVCLSIEAAAEDIRAA